VLLLPRVAFCGRGSKWKSIQITKEAALEDLPEGKSVALYATI
jgi:hypothetical protein